MECVRHTVHMKGGNFACMCVCACLFYHTHSPHPLLTAPTKQRPNDGSRLSWCVRGYTYCLHPALDWFLRAGRNTPMCGNDAIALADKQKPTKLRAHTVLCTVANRVKCSVTAVKHTHTLADRSDTD